MLIDSFSRKLDYLRISITDKCNLRCNYCMPAEGIDHLKHDEVLRNEEFVHFIGIFSRLGIRKIRFTGGEPLVRKGFIEIVTQARALCPDMEFCITTNGILLDEVMTDLINLNVKKLNISLDSMSRSGFKKITRRDYFDRLIGNIEKALSYDFFEIKINSVMHEDIVGELDAFFDYFADKKVVLRFIERMPFAGLENNGEYIDCDGLLEEISKRGNILRNGSEDTRVSMNYDFIYKNNRKLKIGVIPPMSHNFCSQCNRLRLTCDGFLRACLHSNTEFDLKTPYRMDMGDKAIEDVILKAVRQKPLRHNLGCDSFSGNVCSSLTPARTMSKIGG
jgi:GTP 3',8-cyclase